MAIVRRETDLDAIWSRAWTADALADLPSVVGSGVDDAHRGDHAFVTATGLYYLFLDDGTWFPLDSSGGGGGGAYKPLATGEEPMVLVSDGAGAPVMVAFTP
jgi:hypothetical protein